MNSIEKRLERIEQLICEQSLERKEVLNFREACTYLDLSESYLYKLTAGRKIPHFSPNNKKLFFKRSELEKWLLRNRRTPKDELESQAENHLLLNQNRRNEI